MSDYEFSVSLYKITRRKLLSLPAALAVAGLAQAVSPERKKVAAIITEYRRNSHADVIVGRMIEGYDYYGKRRAPGVHIVSMYTDQVPEQDISRRLAAKYGFKIYPDVTGALTLGGRKLAVDGVVLIGEHGNYPLNEKGQQLYPHYRLYRQIIEVFRKSRSAVPVYNDKDLSVDWNEARQMYDRSRELNFPFMAGSSLPVAWRRPPLEFDMEAPVEKAVVSCYGPKERYGFHGLETLQCMVERRKGGETGIQAVQCLEGTAVWEWTDSNKWAVRLLETSLACIPDRKHGSPRENAPHPMVFVLEYRSGLKAAMYLLNGHIRSFGFAAELKGKNEPVSTEFWQPGRPHSHFSGLVYHIEKMIITGTEPYPAERTLLTTGALVAAMNSSYLNGRRMETPHLDITYSAKKESVYNRGEVPPLEK